MFKTSSQRLVAPTLVVAARNGMPSGRTSGAPLTSLNFTLCDRLAGLSAHHPAAHRADSVERLHEEFAESLADQWEALGAQARSGPGPQEAEALRMNRTVGANLATVLRHAPRLLRAFDPDAGPGAAPGDTGLRKLQTESGKVFSRMLAHPTRRVQALVYAAAIQPAHHEALGITLEPQAQREAQRLREQARDGLLDLRTVLQLRDYAHADTGSFNFYRATAILAQQPSTFEVATLFEDLTRSFADGIQRLYALPDARVPGDEVRKGWVSTRAVPLAPGCDFEFRRPFSGTVRAEGSYLLRTTPDQRRYDVDLVLRSGPGQRIKAIHFSIFNAPATAHEGEAMVLPNQRFLVESTTREDVHDGTSVTPVTRCVARKTGEPHIL